MVSRRDRIGCIVVIRGFEVRRNSIINETVLPSPAGGSGCQ